MSNYYAFEMLKPLQPTLPLFASCKLGSPAEYFSTSKDLCGSRHRKVCPWGSEWSCGGHLVLPEAVEASRVHLCVPRGVRYLTVAEVGGERAGVDALIDKLETASVTEKMTEYASHPEARRSAPQHLVEAAGGHRRLALGYEHVARSWLLLAFDAP